MSLALGGTALAAYLIGSIPTGVLLARLKGVDPRATGSGNIGATNVARSAGKALGLATLVLDAAKGALPVLAADALVLTGADPATARYAPVVAALGAVVGHVFPITLGFRGGKGVATALGALAALAPGSLVLPLLAFAVAFGVSRWVSLGSIAAAMAAPVGSMLAGYPPLVTLAITLMALLILFRHRDNMERIRAGTEPRFGTRDAASAGRPGEG